MKELLYYVLRDETLAAPATSTEVVQSRLRSLCHSPLAVGGCLSTLLNDYQLV